MAYIRGIVLAIFLIPTSAYAQEDGRDGRLATATSPQMAPQGNETSGVNYRLSAPQYVRHVYAVNNALVEVSTFAMERTRDEDVRQVAQEISEDHRQANIELLRASARAAVPLPDRDEAKAQFAQLKSLRGAKHDRLYLDTCRQLHARLGALYQQRLEYDTMPALRTHAAYWLEVVQSHYQRVVKVLRGMESAR